MLPLRSQAHLHQIRRLVDSLQPGEPDYLRHLLITASRILHIPRLPLIQDMSILPNQDPIHYLSNHRISSLHGPPLQGTAYQGTDTRPQHPHTYILPYKPPAPELSKASNQSIKIYHLHPHSL